MEKYMKRGSLEEKRRWDQKYVLNCYGEIFIALLKIWTGASDHKWQRSDVDLGEMNPAPVGTMDYWMLREESNEWGDFK